MSSRLKSNKKCIELKHLLPQVRASSQVLSERNISHYGSLVGSLYSLASDYPAIPGNERLHSV